MNIDPDDFADLRPDRSAVALVKALKQLDADWHRQLPPDAVIDIDVPLVGGGFVRLGYVQDLGEDVLYIQGRLNGEQYVLITHQSTVQFLCQVRGEDLPEPPKREIGFSPRPVKK